MDVDDEATGSKGAALAPEPPTAGQGEGSSSTAMMDEGAGSHGDGEEGEGFEGEGLHDVTAEDVPSERAEAQIDAELAQLRAQLRKVRSHSHASTMKDDFGVNQCYNSSGHHSGRCAFCAITHSALAVSGQGFVL
jgi:hypothetical protein